MKAKVAGRELAYDVAGDGPAIVCLHAFPLNRTIWDAQTERFAATHTVVRFDARGLGESPRGDGLLTMERIADDAMALLDVLAIERAVVCGVSMGGYAAFACVRRHAERIRALVLAHTKAEPDDAPARVARGELAEQVRREGSVAARRAMLDKLLGETTRERRPEIVARVTRTIENSDPGGIADALAGLAARADSRPTLGEIGCPCLVVAGDEDGVTPAAGMERMAAAIAGSRFVTLEGVGHLSNLEDPERFNEPVAEFLAAL